MPRELLLMRHAKSSWENPLLSDTDRPLNKRGRRVSLAMGEHLSRLKMEPALVMSSPALRAWQTALLLSSVFEKAVDIHIEDSLYDSSSDKWQQAIKGLADEAHRVMMIGHNPELHVFISEVSDFIIPKFPTSAIAVFEVHAQSWQTCERADFKLKELIIPKKLGL